MRITKILLITSYKYYNKSKNKLKSKITHYLTTNKK